MNKNLISMFVYFVAAGLLFAYAFTSNSIFLYGGVVSLIVAIIFSRSIKK